MGRITPFLWFDTQAAEAMTFYTGIFPNSRVLGTSAGPDGRVLMATFALDGQEFMALNGGPHFVFSEAISLFVECADQAEVDYYWERLSEGGEQRDCGWVKDRFGMSWQIVPRALAEMLADADPAQAGRVMAALQQMTKISVAGLEAAYAQAG